MVELLTVGTVLIKKSLPVEYYDVGQDALVLKEGRTRFGSIAAVNLKAMEYTVVWDGGDWEKIHAWELITRKDIRIPSKAEIILFRSKSGT